MNDDRPDPALPSTNPEKADAVKPDASGAVRGETLPAAGPHATPELTDEERTPGAGTLPEVHEDDVGDSASS